MTALSKFPRLNMSVLKAEVRNLDSLLITPESALWRFLEEKGSRLKGNDAPIPCLVLKNNETVVVHVEYRVRRGLTESGNVQVSEGVLFADVCQYPDKYHEFWESVNLPGGIGLWGSAAVIISGEKLLIGQKKPTTGSVTAVYGGTWTIPAGIVEDYLIGKTVGDALVSAAVRESGEEFGKSLYGISQFLTKVFPAHDRSRCKQQAFVRFDLKDQPELDIPTEEFVDAQFIDPKNVPAEVSGNMSAELVEALQIIK